MKIKATTKDGNVNTVAYEMTYREYTVINTTIFSTLDTLKGFLQDYGYEMDGITHTHTERKIAELNDVIDALFNPSNFEFEDK